MNTVIKWIFFIMVLIGLFIGINVIIKEYTQTNSGNISIHDGANLQKITTILEKYEIVKNGNVFYYYMRMKMFLYEKKTGENLEYHFNHGKYELEKSDFDGLIVQLEKGPKIAGPTYSITIPEGLTLIEIAAKFEEQKIFPKEEFIQYVQDKNVYNQFRQKYEWLPPYNDQKMYQMEGYLKADTYYLERNPKLETIVEKMLEETNGWYKRNREIFEERGLTFDQVLTLASMVEGESKFEVDRKRVAQVFYNRIKLGMKLQSDMTAAYANQEHKVMMTYEDIGVESPYNTYYVSGLPLGPINSPSTESVRGVLLPEGDEFKHIFFYARPSGETFYSETPEGHQANIDMYRHEWESLNQQ